MARALPVIEALRACGMSVVMHAGAASFKSQLQKADASGAQFALIFGDDELAAGQFKVKLLRDRDAPQIDFSLRAGAEDAASLCDELRRGRPL
jgi:histidyl-tRNA synthetase